MYVTLRVTTIGFAPKEGKVWQFKSRARHMSHEVPGCDDTVGPACRFLLVGKRITTRNLTRREIVFGVKAPPDGKGGGFKGLVSWTWNAHPNLSEVKIDIARAQEIGAEGWLEQFVCAVIKKCGWTVAERVVTDSS